MDCVILNRNYPPGAGITGNSANELAAYLVAAGFNVQVVTVDGEYQGGGAVPVGVSGKVHTLSHLYNGKNKFIRLFSSLVEGWKMARKAVALGVGPIICMTDPPLLNFWVARAARRRAIPWIYWSMDLYPEAFVSSKLVKRSNPIYRYLKRSLVQAPPTGLIALGPNQARFINSEYTTAVPTVLLPCGISQSPAVVSAPEWAAGDDRIILGYAGNLGEAHASDFLRAVIAKIDPSRHRFILSVYGSKAPQIIEFASGREGVVITDSVARDHLQFIDVHIATLLPEWDHVCIPSKAVSAVCEGATIFMCCSEETDNWTLLEDAAWRIPVDGDIDLSVSRFMDGLNREEVDAKRLQTRALSQQLLETKAQAFAQIERMLALSQLEE
ncbi:MAG: hypothetical protein KDI17_03910 [Halioglobus sp.]|nr:hypothetical protein [Halioglobus sp.]